MPRPIDITPTRHLAPLYQLKTPATTVASGTTSGTTPAGEAITASQIPESSPAAPYPSIGERKTHAIQGLLDTKYRSKSYGIVDQLKIHTGWKMPEPGKAAPTAQSTLQELIVDPAQSISSVLLPALGILQIFDALKAFIQIYVVEAKVKKEIETLINNLEQDVQTLQNLSELGSELITVGEQSSAPSVQVLVAALKANDRDALAAFSPQDWQSIKKELKTQAAQQSADVKLSKVRLKNSTDRIVPALITLLKRTLQGLNTLLSLLAQFPFPGIRPLCKLLSVITQPLAIAIGAEDASWSFESLSTAITLKSKTAQRFEALKQEAPNEEGLDPALERAILKGINRSLNVKSKAVGLGIDIADVIVTLSFCALLAVQGLAALGVISVGVLAIANPVGLGISVAYMGIFFGFIGFSLARTAFKALQNEQWESALKDATGLQNDPNHEPSDAYNKLVERSNDPQRGLGKFLSKSENPKFKALWATLSKTAGPLPKNWLSPEEKAALNEAIADYSLRKLMKRNPKFAIDIMLTLLKNGTDGQKNAIRHLLRTVGGLETPNIMLLENTSHSSSLRESKKLLYAVFGQGGPHLKPGKAALQRA